jgi:hypothetical protein
MRPPLRIGRWTFPTKKAAEDHVREILRNAQFPDNAAWRHDPISRPLTGEEDQFVRALLEIHPRRDSIVDCGVRRVCVQQIKDSIGRPCRRLIVNRTDDSWRDFAWSYALSPRSAARKLKSILRFLTTPQLSDFKERNFRGVCDFCGRQLDLLHCHVDHIAPDTFDGLVEGWLHSVRLTALDVSTVDRSGYQQSTRIEDPLLEQAWIEYHQINARLRCVCSKCNLSTLRKGTHA